MFYLKITVRLDNELTRNEPEKIAEVNITHFLLLLPKKFNKKN